MQEFRIVPVSAGASTDGQTSCLAWGSAIDRTKALSFRFDGRELQGYAGDTLASALLANGVRLVGRSFKLHRPRGIVGSGPEEPNAIVQVGTGAATLPNQRATEVELYEGLEAFTVRGWPNVRFDVGRVADAFGRVFAAGFYYKSFMAPRGLWPTYERAIRGSAGWGAAPQARDPDRYEHRNAHCDVLVAGGGPAGLMAALAAGKAGARVLICDDGAGFGGRLLASCETIDGGPAAKWLSSMLATLGDLDNVRLLPRSTVFGYHDHQFLTIAERCADHLPPADRGRLRQRLWRVRAKRVVLAQGAFERMPAFCDNDRPGVMLASAVSAYLHRWGSLPGRRAVVFTNNDSAWRTAIDLHAAGVEVAAIVDCRPGGAGEVRGEAERLGIPLLTGHLVTGVTGRNEVRGVHIARWDGDATKTVRNTISIDCDLLAVSGGWNPAVHLHSQAGGRNRWDEPLQCFVPGKAVQAHASTGACNGAFGLQACLREGLEAGHDAARACGFEVRQLDSPKVAEPAENSLQPLWRVPAERDPDRCPKQFIDFQNDTSVADIRLAAREGYRNVEHVKRYTALGFGTDQGKLGNIVGMAVLAECLGEPIPAVGTTTFRPAYTPVAFGTIAGETVGDLFDPERTTAIHEWHENEGAVFEVVGQWLRPRHYPIAGEDMEAAVARECLAVRSSVGLMDASTLGKIVVEGPDAVEFLERVYTHRVAQMKPGRCAYGILLGEDGMVRDDGVMARLDERRFYLTTTTGGAAATLAWLELWLQTEWPELDVYLTSVTDHFSTIVVAGPNSRRLLQNIGCDISLEAADFPFMSVRDAAIDGLDAQLFRVSFSGELAFEVNVDSRHALHLWQRLIDAGQEFGVTPYGTEAMHVLRAEKGFVIVGQDTDGSVSPVDLGMNWLLAKDKDFLGRRSLARPDTARGDRKQWVGLLSEDSATVVPEGAQLTKRSPNGATAPVPMCGHVTSSYYSAVLDHPIALGLVEAGRSRHGEKLIAVGSDGGEMPVRITSPVFYDPDGERQRG